MYRQCVICVIINKDKWILWNEDNFSLFSINSLCTVCRQNVYVNTFKRTCWPYKSPLEANLFRCIFSIWFVSLPQTNSMNTETSLRKASGFHPNLFYSSWRATFTPSFLVLIWAISCSTFFVSCMYSHLFIHLHVSSKPFSFPTACKPNSHPSWLKPNPGCLQMLESSCQSIYYSEQEVLWRYYSRVKLLLTAKLLQRC